MINNENNVRNNDTNVDILLLNRIENIREILVNIRQEILSDYYNKKDDTTICITYNSMMGVYENILTIYYSKKNNSEKNEKKINEQVKEIIDSLES
jgi:hypothetical protein